MVDTIGVVVMGRTGGGSKRSIHKSKWAGARSTDADLNVSELTAQAALAGRLCVFGASD